MKTIDVARAKGSLKGYARQAKSEPVILTDDGKPIAAIVGLENMDAVTLSLSTNPKFIAILERSRKQIREQGSISAAEMRKRFEAL